MKWFKHDSDAHRDAKLRKLLRQHGMAGVGLYWTVLEMIVADIDHENFTFELEHDSAMIADDTGLSVEQVENMMRSMVELGLFECSNGVITCLKLLRRMDSSQVKNPALRDAIKQAKNGGLPARSWQGHDRVMAGPWQGHDRTEQNRTEQNRSPQPEGKTTELDKYSVGGGPW